MLKHILEKPGLRIFQCQIEAIWAARLSASSNVIYVTVLKSFYPYCFFNLFVWQVSAGCFVCVLNPHHLSCPNVAREMGGGMLLFH